MEQKNAAVLYNKTMEDIDITIPSWREEEIVKNHTCEVCGHADNLGIQEAVNLEKTAERIRENCLRWQKVFKSKKNIFSREECEEVYWLLKELEILSA